MRKKIKSIFSMLNPDSKIDIHGRGYDLKTLLQNFIKDKSEELTTDKLGDGISVLETFVLKGTKTRAV